MGSAGRLFWLPASLPMLSDATASAALGASRISQNLSTILNPWVSSPSLNLAPRRPQRRPIEVLAALRIMPFRAFPRPANRLDSVSRDHLYRPHFPASIAPWCPLLRKTAE